MRPTARSLALAVVFAMVWSCAPTALRRSDDRPSPARPSLRPDTTDVLTLREGGSGFYLVARAVATGQELRRMGDGVILPDGTIFSVEPAPFTTVLRATSRRSGATLGSRTIAGEWALRPAGYGPGGTASPNGVFIALTGSSYAYTDASGAWT